MIDDNLSNKENKSPIDITNSLNQVEKNKLNDILYNCNNIINVDNIQKVKEFQIYYNSNELYMIKIGIYLDIYIIFICYEKSTKENELYYIGLYNNDYLIKINKIFMLYKEITDLYNCFINILIQKNKVKISKNIYDTNYINIIINIYLPEGDESYISLKLYKKHKNEDIIFYNKYIELNPNYKNYANDYNTNKQKNYLMKEYKIIKLEAVPIKIKENNESAKKRIWNKNLRNDELFVLFNNIYNTSLKISDKNIILSEKNIKSEGLSRLCQLHFIYIESLQLNKNNISIIDSLINFSSINKLKILKLNDNNIIKIDIFNKCKFIPYLVELYLQNNQIKNLNGFTNCSFKKLKLLYLNNNNIINIDGLRTCNFYNLSHLLLNNNQIDDINMLGNCNLSQLKILNLSNNKIKDITPLTKCNFSKLNQFIINKNKIININCLSKFNFYDLNLLYLQNNQIKNIDVLEKCNFKENLKTLFIYDNLIEKNSLNIIN